MSPFQQTPHIAQTAPDLQASSMETSLLSDSEGRGEDYDHDKRKMYKPATDTTSSSSQHVLRESDDTAASFRTPAASALHSHHSTHSNFSSPASSSIFERNVQEAALPSELAPAIPAHFQTENHIPPVLEASSLAITDSHLGPDEVEIVTHTAHQPAAATVAESTSPGVHSESHTSLSPQEIHDGSGAALNQDGDDTASNYGSLDPNDVRRLSFISFADVVHAEHVEAGPREPIHHLPLSTTALSQAMPQSPPPNRLPSPARSPVSLQSQSLSGDVTISPPQRSGSGSMQGVERSPGRSTAGSPHLGSPQQHGELTIETMRQALRKTASGDLSVARSVPTSAVGSDDGALEKGSF